MLGAAVRNERPRRSAALKAACIAHTAAEAKATAKAKAAGRLRLTRSPPATPKRARATTAATAAETDPVLSPKRKPRSAPGPASDAAVDPFVAGKRAFHRSGAFRLVGRIEEKAGLTAFWYDHVVSGAGACIYVSGNPGTGKTAAVDEMLEELCQEGTSTATATATATATTTTTDTNTYTITTTTTYNATISILKVNCMMLKDPLGVFSEISQAVGLARASDDASPLLQAAQLEAFFDRPVHGRSWVLVLDEVDQVGARDPELLCRLLALPYGVAGRRRPVAVVGIANSIDLTERLLPRLRLLNDCQPHVLHFPQYSVSDISAILADRLARINELLATHVDTPAPFIDGTAIEFAARKVAASGDLRRALDMMGQAIDLAEAEFRAGRVTPGRGLVGLAHVARIVDKFGAGAGGGGPLALVQGLNLHQKVILACIAGHEGRALGTASPRKGTAPAPLTVPRLYDAYAQAASRPPRLYEAVSRSEFADLVSGLEAMAVTGRAGPEQRVFLLQPVELIRRMLDELPTIRALFE